MHHRFCNEEESSSPSALVRVQLFDFLQLAPERKMNQITTDQEEDEMKPLMLKFDERMSMSFRERARKFLPRISLNEQVNSNNETTRFDHDPHFYLLSLRIDDRVCKYTNSNNGSEDRMNTRKHLLRFTQQLKIEEQWCELKRLNSNNPTPFPFNWYMKQSMGLNAEHQPVFARIAKELTDLQDCFIMVSHFENYPIRRAIVTVGCAFRPVPKENFVTFKTHYEKELRTICLHDDLDTWKILKAIDEKDDSNDFDFYFEFNTQNGKLVFSVPDIPESLEDYLIDTEEFRDVFGQGELIADGTWRGELLLYSAGENDVIGSFELTCVTSQEVKELLQNDEMLCSWK
ncbi:hypothetical protein C9374_004010 [Naegleria lovaniensis]|uniref:Uncharacterized protein n=1 Tax=Naegleria lovaniensis TaxID=51637 RepID=A0AA88H638_NAELO|nr:uncharacterized protein C9374_004010 [Naegleria lovaniensis]KAG2394246.1 hypothetical protein C9374_004010 [Naegleria lovaniensis]